MKTLQLVILATSFGFCGPLCSADTRVRLPSTDISLFDARPFLLPYVSTCRFQQVFSALAFNGVPADELYLSRMTIISDTAGGLDVGGLQVNLSTTPKEVDNLSTNFAQNLGPDDTVVFGPTEWSVGFGNAPAFDLVFQRPFVYRPAAGNLLIDVRVFHGDQVNLAQYRTLRGQNVTTDEVSRVFADDVLATIATWADSGGFSAILWFYPIPSLRVYTHFTGGINYFFIEWPTCPTVFRLQQSGDPATGADWLAVPGATNDPTASFQRYWFPVGTGPPVEFYRLFWNGQ